VQDSDQGSDIVSGNKMAWFISFDLIYITHRAQTVLNRNYIASVISAVRRKNHLIKTSGFVGTCNQFLPRSRRNLESESRINLKPLEDFEPRKSTASISCPSLIRSPWTIRVCKSRLTSGTTESAAFASTFAVKCTLAKNLRDVDPQSGHGFRYLIGRSSRSAIRAPQLLHATLLISDL